MTTPLSDLAALLYDGFEADEGPVWVSVYDRSPLNPEPTIQIERELAGWLAPPACTAVGLIASGQAHPLLPGEPALRTVGPIRLACVMDREGRLATRAVFADGEVVTEPPGGGVMIDILRRAFQLPTDPPQWPSDVLLTLVWLSRVLAEAEGRRRLGWHEMALLHPVADALAQAGERPTLRELSQALRVAGSAWTWERLRCMAVDSPLGGDLLSSDLAAWMDEGIFARWLLNRQPTTDALLHELAGRITREALRRTLSLLSETGVLASV